MSDKSVLSDAKLREIYNEACKPHQTVMAAIRAGLRAVADAAIAADRAARGCSECAYAEAMALDKTPVCPVVCKAAPPASPVVPECHWRQDDNVHMPDTWGGACGAKWSFIEGSPVENEMRYCPNCGCRVSIADPAPSQEPKP